MSGFVVFSGVNDDSFSSDAPSFSRSRSNTIHGTSHSALRGAEPPNIFQQKMEQNIENIQQIEDRTSGTTRSPKLFLDCVGIRRRSQSLSYANTKQMNILRPTNYYLNQNDENLESMNYHSASPELQISSTFPPKKDFNQKQEQLAPHPMTQFNNQSRNYDTPSTNDNMDSDYDAMETDESFDESDIHFQLKEKKHVSWPDDNNLVSLHTYKSDKRYYEKNPFYGYGKIEYSSDEEELAI